MLIIIGWFHSHVVTSATGEMTRSFWPCTKLFTWTETSLPLSLRCVNLTMLTFN